MRIAHLILAHDNPIQLYRLVQKLVHADANTYIHIDLKVDIKPFLFLENSKNVFIVKKRIKVQWGSYGIVQATLNGFKEILNSGITYNYINLLSGKDYPLKSMFEIHKHLNNIKGKAFMEFVGIDTTWGIAAMARFDRYHLTEFSFKGQHKLTSLLNKILPKKKIPTGLILVGKSQWFTITPTHAQYILSYLKQHPNIKRYFKFTWGADEFIFQTILYNSKYKLDIINDNLRYINFPEGASSPHTLTILDSKALLSSKKLFARKFDTKIDTQILDNIDNAN